MLYKAFLYIVLISLYVAFFGIKSFDRFKEESIVVIKKNLDIASSEMNARPGMAILPIDPISGKGWKNSDNASHLLNATGDDLRRCLEDLSYLYDEIVFNTRYHASHYTLMSDSFNGLVQVLETSAKYFTYSATTTQSISLNNTPSYFMAFFDPTFAVISGNPDTIPRTLMHIPSNAGFVFLYLRLVYRMNLNTERSPCRDPTNYNYARCINSRVAKSVGCQSFWSNLTGFPVCSDYAQYRGYALEYERVLSLEKNQLLAETGCVRPCNYMEYLLADNPIFTQTESNMAVIHIMLSSSDIILEKEEKAFSFQSLVADVGGVLGLFIGFSFLGLAEFALAWTKKFYERCRKI